MRQEINASGGRAVFEEHARGHDSVSIAGLVPIHERGFYNAHWVIAKYNGNFESEADALAKGAIPFEVKEIEGNLLLNEGINELWTLVCSTDGTAFDTSSYIGVGDNTTAANATQTGLVATANTAFATMDGGYPTMGSSQKATWKATFGTGVANFAWQEITVINASTDAGKNLNRKVQAMGTKASGKILYIM